MPATVSTVQPQSPRALQVKGPAPNNTWTAFNLNANLPTGGSLGTFGGASGAMELDGRPVLVHCGGIVASTSPGVTTSRDCFVLRVVDNTTSEVAVDFLAQ